MTATVNKTIDNILTFYHNNEAVVAQRAKQLLLSGGIDLEQYSDDDFALSKVIICIIYEELKDASTPLDKNFKADYRNLKNF